mmetsp:Transcript_39637/g.98158  ORF Transcript_39637/g.98158 Transcript_39637/m.98158 type:complete len:264 (-) Transcript_39637:58-849(-)
MSMEKIGTLPPGEQAGYLKGWHGSQRPRDSRAANARASALAGKRPPSSRTAQWPFKIRLELRPRAHHRSESSEGGHRRDQRRGVVASDALVVVQHVEEQVVRVRRVRRRRGERCVRLGEQRVEIPQPARALGGVGEVVLQRRLLLRLALVAVLHRAQPSAHVLRPLRHEIDPMECRRRPLVPPELPAEVAEDGLGLHQLEAVDLEERHLPECELAFRRPARLEPVRFLFAPLVEAEALVGEGHALVVQRHADGLAAAADVKIP